MFGVEDTLEMKNLNLVENSKASISLISILGYKFLRSRRMLLVAFYYGKSLNKTQFIAAHLQCMLRNLSIKRNVEK